LVFVPVPPYKKPYISVLKKSVFTYCWLLLFAWQAKSQLPDYHVQMMAKKAGLMHASQVEEMIRDDKGFLWLLAATKAQRFDGKNILSFSFDDRCIGIQQDEEGTVWIASRQNIYRYKNDYDGFEKLPEYASAENKYRSLLQGPGKKLYLLTADGILQWNRHTNKMEPMGIAPFKSPGNFAWLRSYGDWLFYHLGNNTVVRYNTVTAAQDSVYVQQANYMVPLDADNVWVRQGIGSSAMVSFKTKTVSPVNKSQFDKAFTDNRFFILGGFASLPGEFFTILVDKGYYMYNTAKNRFTKINLFYNGLPLTGKPLISPNNFLKEDNGAGWLATEEGLIYFKPAAGSIGLLRSNDKGGSGKWNNDIRNFTEDNRGNIWFGTADGFCRWDKSTGSIAFWTPRFDAVDYLNYPSVKAMGFSNNKIIVGQSEKGFWIFDPVTQRFKRPQFEADSIKIKFEKSFNSNMTQLRNGNFLVLSGGVWLIDKETFYVKSVKIPEAAAGSRKGYEDAQGRIWLLGGREITAMDKNFNLLYSLDDKVRGKWCNAIVQIDENTFWVAAKSLYEIKLQTEKQLAIRPIFPEFKTQHFSNLFKDSLGHIWMCNDEGMYRYVPEKNITEKFDQGDNVQDFYVGVSNSFRGSDGTVYFGSLNGINYFVPEKIPLHNDSLQVQLLNVTVNKDDSSFLLHHSLQNLKHSQNTVAFDFVTPYLYNAEKIQYRYKLEGADKDWINLANATSVRFNSLQPGNYTFNVAASLNGKDWYAMQAPFAFVIKPPFWKTWWFISLLLLTIAALTVFLVKHRINFIKKRETEKTELQKIKTASYQARLETEQVINYFATSISGQTTVEEMLWDVAKNLIGQLGFEDSMIYLWNNEKTVLLQKAGYGVKGSMQGEINKNIYNVPKGKGIVGAAVESGKHLLVNDTLLDKRYFTADGKIMLSELCVPIIHNNETMGAINTEHSAKNFYTDRHLQILTTIASMLADKIDMIEAQQQTREKEVEVLKLNKDLATSQLTTLRAQMNPHFIFNALNSIQQYVLQGNVVEANKYLSKFSKLQREVLNHSDQNFISLEKELEVLNLYLELEQLRFERNFVYEIKMNAAIDADEIKIPPMIIQPFVENSIWHGLMPRQGERWVHIHFELSSDDLLICTVTDNGIGRDASARLKQNGHEQHKSKGLSLVYDRLHILRQQYGQAFEVTIKDLVDTNNVPAGTEVKLHIYTG
jgi:putative methionine-R-sulfoxide reductase with GAF domain